MSNESPYTKHGAPVNGQQARQQAVKVYAGQTLYQLASTHLREWREWRALAEANDLSDTFNVTGWTTDTPIVLESPVEDAATGLTVYAPLTVDGWPDVDVVEANGFGRFTVNTYGTEAGYGFELTLGAPVSALTIGIVHNVNGAQITSVVTVATGLLSGLTVAGQLALLSQELGKIGLRASVTGGVTLTVIGFEHDDSLPGAYTVVPVLGADIDTLDATLEPVVDTRWIMSLRREGEALADSGPEREFLESEFYDASGNPQRVSVQLYTADYAEGVTLSFDLDSIVPFWLAIDLGILLTATDGSGDLIVPSRELALVRSS